jgi:hypothetical protein
VKGISCGNSFISPSKTCRVGLGNYDISKFPPKDQKTIERVIGTYEAALEKLIPPEAHSLWTEALSECLKGHHKRYSSDEKGDINIGEHFKKQIEKAQEMMKSQPRYLKVGDKTFEAPPGLIPDFPWIQAGWREPVSGTTYNTAGKTGVSEIKGQSGGASWAQVHITGETTDAISFRKEQEKKGEPWPLNPTHKPSKEEVNSVYESVKGSNLWISGGNMMQEGKKRNELVEYYGSNIKSPDQQILNRREAKERAVIESWLSYGKKDPITGKSIALPNVKGVTIDHKQPMAEIAKGATSLEDKVSKADRAENFYVTRGGLQGLRRDNDWKEWLNERNTPQLNRDEWVASTAPRQKKNPPVMSLTREQFEQRYKGLNYDNPADREVAARAARADLLKVYTGGSAPKIDLTPVVKSPLKETPQKLTPERRNEAKEFLRQLQNG